MVARLLVCVATLCNAIILSMSLNSTAFVQFDPYVSILDKANRYRYNDTDLFPFVAKIATKFSNIYVQLSMDDLNCTELCTSQALSPIAVAKYNSLFAVENPLQVWLGYSVESIELRNHNFIYHRKLQLLINDLQSLADRANNIFKGTVTKILLPYVILRNNLGNINTTTSPRNMNLPTLSKNQSWGVLVDRDACFEDKYYLQNLQYLPPIIIVMVIPPITLKARDEAVESKFNSRLENCQDYLNKQHGQQVGFYLSIPDTENNNMVNLSGLVSTWNEAISWSNKTKYPVILSKAFDTPYEKNVERQTAGWWRLVEGKEEELNRNTTLFRFEDKSILASEKVEPEEFPWRKNNKTFSRNNTGVIFSFFDKTRLHAKHSPKEQSSLHKLVAHSFGHLVLLLADDSFEGEPWAVYDLENVEGVQGISKLDITVLFMPHIRLSMFYHGSAKIAMERYPALKPMSHISTFIISFAGDETIEEANHLKNVILVGMDYTFGYAFNMSMCGKYEASLDAEEKAAVDEVLNDDDAKVFFFYFEENQETIKLGAERMYQRRVVLFEQCRNWLDEKIGGKGVKVSFVMFHYSAQPEAFYYSKWDMDHFIRYWQMLSDWATETDTTVIFSNAIDGDRIMGGKVKEGGQIVSELGWWRLNRGGGGDGDHSKLWVDKKQDAIARFRKVPMPPIKAASLSTGQILLAALLPLFFVVIILLSAFFVIRKYYKQALLTKAELNEFLYGNELAMYEIENTDAQNTSAPYDMSRYEIDEGNFNIEQNGCLGAGEFGMVFRGTVRLGGATINVAVKMPNPIKMHKTVLTGLLAEIKVLSHLGKHDNITELIGANTSGIMDGQVYIFLELCDLGSLQKYLVQQRPPPVQEVDYVNTALAAQEPVLDNRVQKYLDLIAIKSACLIDNSLSNNLYQWSREICNGMAYLASKHVVHADLATRNVLLSGNLEAKICDFGLSRRMYNYTNYVKKQQEPLPWKWMSPESLRLMEFNEKSDVWAYGVTLWEIYTLGDKPYPGLSWSLNFPEVLEHGLRLPKPKFDDRNIYQVMKECWTINPLARPSFTDLLTKF